MNTRILPVDRWTEIEHVFRLSDEPKPDPELTRILAVENKGEIIATFGSQWMVNCSHLWVKEEHRGKCIADNLAKRMIESYPSGTQAMMLTTNEHVEKLAFRIGMRPIKGNAWIWR